jgi:multidrug resistance protein MdtO
MASEPIHLPHPERFSEWLPEFLKRELAPYPGRGALVARIVISATLTMILLATFRIPGGVVGALSAFIFSRENLVATARSALAIIAAFAVGAFFIPVGARLLASTPETHFLWVGGSLFLVFFLLRCLSNYGIASGLALVVANVIGIWYLPGPAEKNLELTLWLVAATFTGALVTLTVEVVFYALNGRDDLLSGIDTRLALLEELMASYAEGREVSHATQNGLSQFAIVGAGALRRHLARANYVQIYRARMSTLVSLVARSIDFAAALANAYPSIPPDLRERAANLRRSLADIRQCLQIHARPCEATVEPRPSPGTPLLSEIESMVSLMPSIFSDENATDPTLESVESAPESGSLLIPDAFSNSDHLRYVMGGTLAAMLCYILYVALAWPGLSTSVTTCVLTALTTIGSSRQKQILRVAGFILGGVIAGLGSQIFILPYIDSIGGFTVLFAVMTAIAAWLATASSRLAYAGVQFAFAFFSIHLTEFSFQTNLAAARDRALGVLLGITMMWLVFERLSTRSASSEMVRIFIGNLRQMANLVSSSPRGEDRMEVLKIRRLRDAIYRNFGEVTAQSDAVPFETGPARAGDMAARDRIRRWQTSLRSFYLLEAPLLQFRVFGRSGVKSKAFTTFEDDFRFECGRIFLDIARNLETQLTTRTAQTIEVASIVQRIDNSPARVESEFTERERALLRLTRTIAQLVDHLQVDVASAGLYDVPETVATGASIHGQPSMG